MNIDQLKKVIQQANPEIMELKIGCKVLLAGGVTTTFVHENNLFADSDRNRFIDHLGIKPRNVEIKKILGRPIRLADVLLAVNEMEEGMDLSGSVRRDWWKTKLIDVVNYWDLHDDNLDHQSDETKQFLFDLLVPQPPKAVAT